MPRALHMPWTVCACNQSKLLTVGRGVLPRAARIFAGENGVLQLFDGGDIRRVIT